MLFTGSMGMSRFSFTGRPQDSGMTANGSRAASFKRLLGSPAATLMSELIDVLEQIEPDPQAHDREENADCTYRQCHPLAVPADGPQQRWVHESPEGEHAEW